MEIRAVAQEAVEEATGRRHRDDPIVGPSGGPAGNARLTAWIGLVLLVLFAAEIITLIDVRSLISWHVLVGVALIPPALLKTATTGWRMVRYYTNSRTYRVAGPPPLILRVLGPLVVASTLGVLGSGLALIFMDPTTARQPWIGPITVLMIHKGMFVIWGFVTGIHTLGRLVPALRLTVARVANVPGRSVRMIVLATTLTTAVIVGVLALSTIGSWRNALPFEDHGDRPHHSVQR